jgi:hypothetical protein
MKKNFTIFILITLVGLALRFYFASMVKYPGKAEEVSYSLLANNLYDGKGFVDEYIYIFGNNPPVNIIHPSNGVFMPLASIIIYFFYILFGKSVFVSLIPSIIAGFFISLLIFLFLKEVTENKLLRFAGFSFSLFLPLLFTESLIPSSKIFYTLFVLWSFYWIMTGLKRNYSFLILSSIPAALAFLTESSGILIVLTLLLFVFLYRRKLVWKKFFWFILIFALLVLPWIIRDYLSLGYFFVLDIKELLFLRSYEDLFNYSMSNLINSSPNTGLLNILISKIGGCLQFIGFFISDPAIVLSILSLAGIIIMIKEKSIKREFEGYIFFSLLVVVLFSIFFTSLTGGYWVKSISTAILPFLIIIAISGIENIIKNFSIQRTFVFTTLFIFLCSSFLITKGIIYQHNLSGEKQAKIKDFLSAEKEEPVIISRYPIDVNFVTGFKAIMLPDENDSTVLSIVKKYNANYIINPIQEAVMKGEQEPKYFKFKFVDAFSDLKLYRILLDSINVKDLQRK